MSIYRIKPLVWEKHDHVHIAKTPVYEFRVGEHEEKVTFSIRPAGPEMEHVPASSVADAKDACRRWWEANALRFLEPAYQPTTELPTEPGLYWFRQKETGELLPVEIRVHGTVFYCGGAKLMRSQAEIKLQGTWIRIPEPEDAV